VDSLLGRGRQPASSAICISLISRIVVEKVEYVRSNTVSALPPTFRFVQPSVSLHSFSEGAQNAGVENADAQSIGGKCRGVKCGSRYVAAVENAGDIAVSAWKAVRRETYVHC